jgi:hypothetical protein
MPTNVRDLIVPSDWALIRQAYRRGGVPARERVINAIAKRVLATEKEREALRKEMVADAELQTGLLRDY